MWVAFAVQKLLTFFQQKIQHICISLDVNFNESLTNDVVSFEQLGLGCKGFYHSKDPNNVAQASMIPIYSVSSNGLKCWLKIPHMESSNSYIIYKVQELDKHYTFFHITRKENNCFFFMLRIKTVTQKIKMKIIIWTDIKCRSICNQHVCQKYGKYIHSVLL